MFHRLTVLFLVVASLASPSAVSGQVGARVDETLVWNQVMIDAIVASTLGNPQTMRMAATVNTAMFDARNGVSRKYTPIFVTQTAPPGTHRRAATVQAAYVTLKAFYPEQLARFDKQRSVSLAEFKGDDAAHVQRGVEWGEQVANQILAWRATDGFSNPVPPMNGAGAVLGQWESATKAAMAPANISFTAPFVLASNIQFQWAFPRPWARLDSAAYAASFNEVATMGVKAGSRRTVDQTHIAYFFNGYVTTDYVEAASQIARAHQTSRGKNSRIFALLAVALHDASVTVFRAKRDFGLNPAEVTWRPILAIPKAEFDGNPKTTPIAGWVPLLPTPNHPEYPASHPGSHGAGPRVLQHFFGDANAFEVHPAFNTVFPGPPEGGVQPRRYTRISDMAQDGFAARTYGGMHFRGASDATALAAARIADYVVANAARPVDGDDADPDEPETPRR
ncbi:MAG: vanadium-dependent haloperoxidase [Candidatus Rokuibacteriota bacterium]